jgi:hypothetical protein
MKALSFESETTKTRAGSAGSKPFVTGCANNYVHLTSIAKAGLEVNAYFWANRCDSNSLEHFSVLDF